MKSEEIEEIFNWIVSVFAGKYAEAVREKDYAKAELLKSAMEGALVRFEHEVLLHKLKESDTR